MYCFHHLSTRRLGKWKVFGGKGHQCLPQEGSKEMSCQLALVLHVIQLEELADFSLHDYTSFPRPFDNSVSSRIKSLYTTGLISTNIPEQSICNLPKCLSYTSTITTITTNPTSRTQPQRSCAGKSTHSPQKRFTIQLPIIPPLHEPTRTNSSTEEKTPSQFSPPTNPHLTQPSNHTDLDTVL